MPKSVRILGHFFLCALVFLPNFSLFGQESVIQRVTAPITAPIHSVLSFQPREPRSLVNSALPGLGTLPIGNGGESPPVFAGSLEFLPPETAYLPSIYVEGQGYVPLTHPSVQPYIDPTLLQHPEADPAVVMIPTLVSRQIESTGKTTLSLALEQDAEPIVISAQTGWHQRIGQHDVYFLCGDCSLRQGSTAAQGPEAVVWISAERNKTSQLREVTLYLESNSAQMPIRVEQNNSQQEGTQITDQKWLGHWYTRASVDVMIAMETSSPPHEPPSIFKRAALLMDSGDDISQTQYLSSTAIPTISAGSNPAFRRVHLNARGDTSFGIYFEPYYPNEPARGGIVVLTGGINLVIEGLKVDGVTDSNVLTSDTVDISADNAVIWTENPGKMHSGGSYTESETQDFEVYLEGNIIYRDGPRVIEASRMYYDAKHKIAYILHGHLTAPISNIRDVEGSIRLKADILRQMGDGLFTAKNAMVTTSQLGEPTYSLRSRTLKLDRRMSPPFGNSDSPFRQVVVAENNYIAARNVPIFYWPWIAADVEDPTFYIKRLSYGNSANDGHTVKTLWDPFQILNIRRPDGVNGDVNVAWMEKRGISYGTDFQYSLPAFCYVPGQTNGSFVFWGIRDHGTDRLGGRRRSVTFPDPYRYRLHWVHQQQVEMSLPFLAGPWDVRAEIGKVSDRNLLNSFFNSTWNNDENATTAIDLTRRKGNQSFTLSTEYALDSHYSNANWLPRLDHYWLGQSLINDYFTWYEHTRIGYADYHTADVPYDTLQDARYFRYLPWEYTGNSNNPNTANTVSGSGIVFSTRHELDLPIQAGALKIVPYMLGDFSLWGEDQTGAAVDRLYGQGGVRLNLPIWKVNPRVSSRTWYLNGLTHKIDLDAEYLYAQANSSMENLILTDPIDNWSIDDFRRRYLITNPNTSFNGIMLPEFDPRYYALRSGLARNVTAGNMEIADDLQMFRFGMTHRFQTKRGSVGKRRILDWITFSTHVNFYPQSQHNFGKEIGLLDYRFLWHVGDRFSLFSEGFYDFFDNGQNLTRIGGVWNRPDRGRFSLTLDQFSGVIERTYLTLGIDYSMNEKYSVSYSTSYNIRNDWQNVGHNFMFVRTGESFRLLLGAVYSEALSEWSFSMGLEPVFLRSNKRSAVSL